MFAANPYGTAYLGQAYGFTATQYGPGTTGHLGDGIDGNVRPHTGKIAFPNGRIQHRRAGRVAPTTTGDVT